MIPPKGEIRSARREIVVSVAIVVLMAILSFRFNLFEHITAFVAQHEAWQLDEVITVLMILVPILIVVLWRRSYRLKLKIRAHEMSEMRAQRLARHDALTGLPNRRKFNELLNEAVLQAARQDKSFALLLLDLDRFKPVNDSYGHAMGDLVLGRVAERLRHVVRANDHVARIGGDEFAILVEVGDDTELPLRLAQRVIHIIDRPIIVADTSLEIGATIGVALCPADASTADSLLRAADAAMYRAKREGRGRYCFFEADMDAEMHERSLIEQELRAAIREGQIRPHYQPIVNLTDGEILGFEVLARWYHPEKGIIPPDLFIPIAEDTAQISALTFALIRTACTEALHWPEHIILSVNVSPSQVVEPDFPERLDALLQEIGFAPQRLAIEITESALISDMETARKTLHKLQARGMRIALDDFGTGYSSLYHLRELHFDAIKIDHSFVQALGKKEGSEKIVSAVIGLGKSLDLPTTAEGIEDVQDLDRLLKLGCRYGQGFYFGKPEPAGEVEKLLKAKAEEARQAPVRQAPAA